MIKDKSVLAIIPARGGSKRLPRKNLLPIAGRPLIAWTIDAALKSEYIDEVLVTSDDKEILEVSKKSGSNIIKRPSELANDTTSTFDAIKHAIDNTKKHDYIILLQPTSPLRTAKHIDEALKLIKQKNADAAISVCQFDHNPIWSNTLSKDLSMKGFIDEKFKNKRSQDLPSYYRLNGAIYICETSRLLAEKSFMLTDNIYAFIMDRESSIDIDTELDLIIAELILKRKNNL